MRGRGGSRCKQRVRLEGLCTERARGPQRKLDCTRSRVGTHRYVELLKNPAASAHACVRIRSFSFKLQVAGGFNGLKGSCEMAGETGLYRSYGTD